MQLIDKLKKYLIDHIVTESSSIKEALKVIDKNKGRFVFVVTNEILVGVISDGDIRRMLLSGVELNDKIEIRSSYEYLDVNDNFAVVCEKLRKQGVDFLPILNKGRLVHFITKSQFHIMLLEDVDYSPDINFQDFNSIDLEHEIYNRPWGFYKSTWLNSHAQAKIITIFPDSEISLQKHFKREEHWIVVKGKGVVIVDDKKVEAISGKYFYIPVGSKHKIINTSVTVNLTLSEVQLGSYFGEDDIVRYQDKYGRS